MTMNLGGVNPYANMYAMNSIGLDAPMLNAGSAMGMGMGYGYMNPQYQMQTMAQWDKFGIDRQVDTFQRQNNAQFKMSTQTDRVARQAKVVHEKAISNSQNTIQKEYNELVQAVRDTYGAQLTAGLSAEQGEAQIKAYADRLYAQQTGAYVEDDIRKNADGSFVSGLKQVLTLGLGNRKSAAENISKIQGISLSKSDKASKIAGQVTGGAVLATGALLINKYRKPIGSAIMSVLKFFTKVA